jgi:hypothetical protein
MVLLMSERFAIDAQSSTLCNIESSKTLPRTREIRYICYAGSEVELLAIGGDSNAAATPVFFSALLRNPEGIKVYK